jgi:hypothetical protein
MRILQKADGTFVDQRTGEVLEKEQYTFVAIPSRQKIKEDWFMAFQDAFKELSKDRELWGRPIAVLHFLMSKLSFENFIAVEQKEICEELDLLKPHVSEAMKKLCEKGIVEKGPRVGNTRSYKLNPFYGWKGRVKNLQDERKMRLKAIDGGKSAKK